MKISFLLSALIALSAAARLSAAQQKIGDHTFTLPDGFEIERVATREMVDRPVTSSFDEQGRLYVTDSSGSNDKPEKQLAEKPHRVVRLEDTDGNGKFDKSVVFADKMMFPEGCLWFEGSLYVSAPPSIWKLTDTNNDGVADLREEWHQGKTLTGCANDLHGPMLGPDGSIYWCKGAFAEQTYALPNGKEFKTRAAHIFRKRADGTGIEPVMTGGMDNPVSVAFTENGEPMLVGTFFQNPEGGKRDGIIHVLYGGVYGKVNDVLEPHKKAGSLLGMMTHMGPAAPCSIIRYKSKIFGADFQNNLLVCSFNMHKVSRHVVTEDGSSFRTIDSDFLVSDNPDFHPTDVVEDADGSLIVLDTGGWYKLCCPTSQLAKPDVLGAIYRVRRKGATKPEDPRGLKIPWNTAAPGELVKLLGDERPFVRDRAIASLANLGMPAIPPLREATKLESAEARRNAIWALARINASEARSATRQFLTDADPGVQACALHSISLWKDAPASPALLKMLTGPGLPLRRLAAEALGRIGDKSAVEHLLRMAGTPMDRSLEHALIYALIEIAAPVETARGLNERNAKKKTSALIALDQMEGGSLTPGQVIPLLNDRNEQLRQVASWVVEHHPDWGSALAGFFQERIARAAVGDAEREDVVRQLARLSPDKAVQDLLATSTSSTNLSARLIALNAMARSNLRDTPPAWSSALRQALADSDSDVASAAVAAAKNLPSTARSPLKLDEPLLAIGNDAKRPASQRLEALAARRGELSVISPELFAFLREQLDPSRAPATRSTAAAILGKSKLPETQLAQLTADLKTAGPLEIARLLGAFDGATNEEIGLKLVGALAESKALANVRADLLKTRLEKFPAAVQQQGKGLLSVLNLDVDKQKARLDDLLTKMPKGDVRRGQLVFNGTKAACSTCHAMGYLGGTVGPDLTTIGTVRTERDLLESIVYPSASFVRSFEPSVVVTRSGEEYSGLVKRETPEEILLVNGPNSELRLPRSNIAEMRPGTLSVMPAGLDEQLSREELADLLAFLKNTKWGAQ
jgi:putative heme-binding domain-containing protein